MSGAAATGWPAVGADWSVVGSVTSPDQEASSRLFLPLIANGMRHVPWSVVAGRAGVPLEAHTGWEQIEARLDSDDDDPRPQFGGVDRKTLEILLDVLAGEVRSPRVTIALWLVYDELDRVGDLELTPVPRVPGADRWHDGMHVAAEIELPELSRFADDDGARFPSAVVPEHGEFLLACPGYSDSLYLSSRRALCAALTARGLDLRQVDRTRPLPDGTHAG